MKPFHRIQEVKFLGEKLILRIDGKMRSWNLRKISPRLAKAKDSERKKYKISPSGYGIHWPLIDEDISISSLLRS